MFPRLVLRGCQLWPSLLILFVLFGQISHAQGQERLNLRQAQFSHELAPLEQEISLPDTWRQRGLPARGQGRYRLHFTLDQAPPHGQAWALRAERLSRLHRVLLNGAVVHEQADSEAMRLHASPAQTWLELPSALLRPGPNELVLELYYQRRAGLSDLWIGPAAELEPGYQWMRWREAQLPQWINMLAAGFSLLLLLVWMERRHERSLGLFAWLCLLTSLRNSVYGLSLPLAWVQALDLFFYLAQVASIQLLGRFALAWSERALPWYRHSLRWTAWPLLLGGVLASWLGALETWRSWAYPVVLLLGLPALGLVGLRAFRVGGWRRLALAGAMLLMMGAAVFDYLVGQGRLSVMHAYSMPWIQPLAMIAFATLLAERLVVALRQSERQQAELERQVAERTAQLQAAHLAKSRLLDAASHDLRQPVTALGLLVGMARFQTQEPRLRQLLDQAGEGVRGLERLLKGLLDHSRLDQQDRPVQTTPLRLQPLLDAVLVHAGPLARERGLRLRVRPCALWVRSEPLLLEQVLRNLVSNAITHTSQGSVMVVARRRGAQLCLQVRDSGPGIPPEAQQRIFEPFVQLGNPARSRQHGSGLGLAIVDQALRRLGHSLQLRSAPGRGSCFSVLLPLCEAPSEASAAPAPSGPSEADKSPAVAPQTIWLVEDDVELQQALSQQLEAWGHCVCSFDTAEALWAQWPAPPDPAPDWVLADHRLPGMKGETLLQRIASLGGPSRLALMTADLDPASGAILRSAAWPTLQKPFSPQVLQALLSQTTTAPVLPTKPAT